ncbi:MAG TPA: amino acid adenylation domain-containing protein [Burkholderiaceae bacterium]
MIDPTTAEATPAPPVSIHARIAAQALARPRDIAVVCEGVSLTYAELNWRAECVAVCLRALGAGRDTLVAIGMERSVQMIVGLLGILKSGAAYLPLDPAYPKERLEFMLADAAPLALITSAASRPALPAFDAAVLLIEDVLDGPVELPAMRSPDVDPDALAYVIYTSGSTGKPKGCQLTHGNVMRLFTSTEAWFGFDASDVWTFFHSHAFDFSVWEIWGALVYGGRVVVVPYLVSRSPRDFHALLVRERVTVLNQTPSAFRLLIEADAHSGAAPGALSLRCVIFGGEALELQMLKGWVERHGDARPRLVNMYGITETTVHVSYRPIRRADIEARRGSVIGVPIPDLGIWMLDAALAPVRPGDVGEMYVSGAGVCRGYLNRPELTAERFLDWTAPGAVAPLRLYKTGDLARELPDGDLEYLGRIDHQVKIRGFRIETGEIESQLSTHPRVRGCAVIARSDGAGDKQLVAYVVAPERGGDLLGELRVRLRATLPEHMIPAHFVFVDALPLTANGKLDRDALPAPSAAERARGPVVDPRNAMEHQVWAIWRDVLRGSSFGVLDNFFEIGGDSLKSVELQMRLEEQFGARLSSGLLLEAPTIAQQAVAMRDQSPSTDPLVQIRAGARPHAVFLVHDGFGEILAYRNLAHLLQPGLPVYGMSPVSTHGIAMPYTRIGDIAASYVARIRQAQPHGPYLLGGLCAGGVIAHEMARQLQRDGEIIGLLALMDASDVAAHKRTGRFARDRLKLMSAALRRKLSRSDLGESVDGVLEFSAAAIRLMRQQIAVRLAHFQSRMKARLLRFCLDRGHAPPGFVRDLSVDQIYTFAEAGHRVDGPVEGDMLLFRASAGNGDIGDEPFKNLYTDPLLGWGPRVTGSVVSFDIGGGHYSMLQEPNVRTLAAHVQRRIDAALSDPQPVPSNTA